MPDDKNNNLKQTPAAATDAFSVSQPTPVLPINQPTPTAPSSTPDPPTAIGSSTVQQNVTTVEPETVITSPQAPQKYGGRKIIATIFGVLILIVGVAVAVFLVQRQQDLRQRASSGRECSHSPDCVLLEDPGNTNSYVAPRTITRVFITAQEAHEFNSEITDNGCYRVSINGTNLQWQRYSEGPSCKDISNIQVWLGGYEPSPTSTPEISAVCGAVKAYSQTWNQLSQEELNALSSGSRIRFAVEGTTNSGSFDKAKFIINGEEVETTTLRPGTNEFYVDYTIPAATQSFTVNAQVHHSTLGWF